MGPEGAPGDASLVVMSIVPLPLANSGLPMLAVTFPLAILAFVPVVMIEAAVAERVLKQPFGRCFAVATWANLFTTLVGVPLTWGALVILQMLTGGGGGYGGVQILELSLGAAWLLPFEQKGDWRVPAAAMALLIPFGLMSVAVEKRLARRILHREIASRELTTPQVGRWAWIANAITYGCLAGFWLIVLALLPGWHEGSGRGIQHLLPG